MGINRKLFFWLGAIFAGLGFLLITTSSYSEKFRMIACDVGQGDGILLISPGGQQILVDGGPGKKILDCLSDHMPFWDRKVEMMVSTHGQKDHMEGLLAIVENYKVGTILATGVPNKSNLFAAWEKETLKSGALVHNPVEGEIVNVDRLSFKVLWPSRDKLELWKISAPKDLNETSVVMRVNFGDFCIYLTGDLPKELLEKVIDRGCKILKVSHHGSKTGTNGELISKVAPEVAIIQVGNNNQYGHPHKEVIEILASNGVKILRNDTNGVIEIESDGKGFKVKSEK